jgi:hypothetical protein
MENILTRLNEMVGGNLSDILIALGILVGGWLVAVIVAKLVRAALRRTTIDNKIAEWVMKKDSPKTFSIEAVISKAVFFLIMLFVLVAFFQKLGLTAITEPLNSLLTKFFDYAPQLLGAVVLLLIAWGVATVLRMLISKGLSATGVDERLSGQMESKTQIPLSKTLGEVVYWLVFLFFLPAILGALKLEGLLAPVTNIVNKIFGFLPNIITAAVILAVGWFVARIVQRIVSSLLAAVGLDRLGEKVGLDSALGKQKLSGLVGLIVYVLILLPIIVSALNALALDAITRPASNMLDSILAVLPSIFAASMILLIAFLVGKVVSGLVTNVLAGVGFNNILSSLGFGKVKEGNRTPSELVGSLVMIVIMFFATIEAVELLGFGMLSGIMAQFTIFAGQIIMGMVIFAVGLFLANLAARTIQTSLLANTARIAILVLTGAMALRQMGLANEIINLAFGLGLGAIAVALAISFGIGGREIAAKQLNTWTDAIGSNGDNSTRENVVKKVD